MTPQDLQNTFSEYVTEARRLQKAYAGQIEILVGVESDMIREEWLQDISGVVAAYQLDYIVGSVHHVNGMSLDWSAEWLAAAESACGGTEQLFVAYYRQLAEMIERLRPTIVGHFDLVRLFRQQQPLTPAIAEAATAAAAAAARHGCLVELNSAGLRKKLMAPYPHPDVLKVCVEREDRTVQRVL
jgi:histidinol-phosphatase (PHP family)